MAMKFRVHDTFFIRKGWLSKGMKYVEQSPDVFISKEDNPMDVLGIGANMVKALRKSQICGITSLIKLALLNRQSALDNIYST